MSGFFPKELKVLFASVFLANKKIFSVGMPDRFLFFPVPGERQRPNAE